MLKQITAAAVLGMVGLLQPLTSTVFADQNGWDPIMSVAAWNYDGFQVERLAWSEGVIGPLAFGNAVVIAEPTFERGLAHAFILRNGMKHSMGVVPVSALNVDRFYANGNRFVYATPVGLDGTRYSVVEKNLETGATIVLVPEVFFNGATRVDARVDGNRVYFETELKYDGSVPSATQQQIVSIWNKEEERALVIGKHWELHREEIQDTFGNLVLVKMIFPNNYKQLWVYDSANMTRESVPGSWTEPHGEFRAAHFRQDGTVEFFQYFVRNLYNPSTKTPAQKFENDLLSWNRASTESFKIIDRELVWVTPEDGVRVSNGTSSSLLGTAQGGRFAVEGTRVMFETATGGTLMNLDGSSVQTVEIAPRDLVNNIVAGVKFDADGTQRIWFRDLLSQRVQRVGFGSKPVVSDNTHIYWRGQNKEVFEATVFSNWTPPVVVNPPTCSCVTTQPAVVAQQPYAAKRALRATNSSDVYLVIGGVRYVVPSEEVYFTWFSSWNNVELVSSEILQQYPLRGLATLASGSKARIAGDEKLYVVLADGKLHHVQNLVATFGPNATYTNVHTLSQMDLVNYSYGEPVKSERDLVY